MSGDIISIVLLTVLATITVVAILCAIYALVLRPAWRKLASFYQLMDDLRNAAGVMQPALAQLAVIMPQIQAELAFMRQATQASAEPMFSSEAEKAMHSAPSGPRRPIQFPPPNLERYLYTPVEPPGTKEAKLSDTDLNLANQTEQDLIEQEQLEELRKHGIEVPPDPMQANEE